MVEAAMKPMKERLEATILPMQRTLESLQAEFIALRSEEKDNEMSSSAAADAKRMRTDADRCSLVPPAWERCEYGALRRQEGGFPWTRLCAIGTSGGGELVGRVLSCTMGV